MDSIRNICMPLLQRRTAALAALLACLCLALASCHDDSDDYYATALVELSAPEGVSIKQLQGTVTLYNINSRQTFATSSFEGNTASIDVLRGAYSATAEGSLRYIDSQGREQTGAFRASADYCEAMGHPSRIVLKIILM